MSMKVARDFFCWGMVVLMPAALMAGGSGLGTMHPYGTVWMNGAAVEQSSAIFPGDLVQTSSNSALKISSSGSSVTVLSDSLVKFDGGSVSLQHGAVKLATATSMVARAGTVTAVPASNAWTEFEMTAVNGTVQIVALKGDLQISNGSQTAILSHGQQATKMDFNGTQSGLGQFALVPSASAGRASSFAFGPTQPTDVMFRGVEVAADRGIKAEATKPRKHISPIKP